jgi:hypothetical protein
MKTVFVFNCRDESENQAYTTEKSGSNLPALNDICVKGWKFLKEIAIFNDPYSLIGANPTEILKGIQKNGYYIKLHRKAQYDLGGKEE